MTAVLETLARELLPLLQQEDQKALGYKHDATGTPITVGYTHGDGGVLSFPGVDPQVFHTIMGNRSLLGQLPTKSSLFTNPTYYTITGVQDVSGSEAAGVCDAPPQAGLMKACLTTSVFGRYSRETQELDLNRLGAQVDRADPMDLSLIGTVTGGSGVFSRGPGSSQAPVDLLTNELGRKMWELGVAMHRLLSVELWQGNPANDTGEEGSKKQLTGLATLINTGYVDAETATTCPSIDSDLKDFNFGRLDLAGVGNDLIDAVTAIYFQLKDRATRTGLMPVRWLIAMRPQLFYEITRIWPCSYLTYRCQLEGNERITVDAQDAVKLRDDMFNGKYLLIDGEKVQVMVDDGIQELTNTTNGNVPSGCFGGDIYFIPMSVIGGRSVTFLEYFQYTNPAIRDALAPGGMVLGRIEGAFLTVPVQTRYCFKLQTKLEPRLVLRTPWLAGRLQNVVYCPTQHERDTFPGDPYHVDGGRTSRVGPSLFTLWESA